MDWKGLLSYIRAHKLLVLVPAGLFVAILLILLALVFRSTPVAPMIYAQAKHCAGLFLRA